MATKVFDPLILFWIPNAYFPVLSSADQVLAITRYGQRQHLIRMTFDIKRVSLLFSLSLRIGTFFVEGGDFFASFKVPFDDMTFLSGGEQPIKFF